MDDNERYRKGYDILKRLDAEESDKILKNLCSFAPDMGRFIVEFAYGDIYNRAGLDLKSRQIATIAALTAMGTADNQLKFHVGAALNIGITTREIIEVIYLVVVFASFPSSLNSIYTAWEIFKAREICVEKSAAPSGIRQEKGLAAMAKTSGATGRAVIDDLANIAPDLRELILELSSDDMVARKNLSPKWKEYALISAAVTRGNMIPQVKVHVQAALNVGCSRTEIIELFGQMTVYAGFPAALNALYASQEILMAE
jgi:4-carboxymuconolactone decarboxylase